ncbi:hypothetical protein [uncultured Vagococcus sp.]|uniref:hypothetical protein n=1 Tax=uncultured Vagococcus sp. TaxID=189676 RepID=UPI0028D71036|nr:hypothetical protein [uncultured Vagococcus sp.]
MSVVAVAVDPLAKNGLANLNTTSLVLASLVMLMACYIIAFRHRKHYDAKELLREFGWFSLFFTVGALVLQLKIILIIGLLLAGLIVTALRSNHYFYQR